MLEEDHTWVWCIASLAPDEADVNLADRAAKEFSVIWISATTFGRGDYLGQQPFEGRGPPWTSMQMNEEDIDEYQSEPATT